jgi:hypothetical protein
LNHEDTENTQDSDYASRITASRYASPFTFAVILLAALALRLCQLSSIPPGLTHDEAGHGHDAAAVLAGYRPVYFTVGYGREPLFDYFNAAVLAVAGQSALALRASAVFWGLAALGGAYLWASAAFGPRVALGAAALMAVSFWPLAVSRQALRSGMLPGLFALAAWAWWKYYYLPGASRLQGSASPRLSLLSPLSRSSFGLFLFPVLLAACLYTYLPARGLWLLFPLFLAYTILVCPRNSRWKITNLQSPISNLTRATLTALLAAAALALPLFAYLWTHPGAEQRLAMLDGPVAALRQGDPGPLLSNAAQTLLMFAWPGSGDHFLAYNLPGRPVFDPVVFALFAGGLVLCLRRWREPACAFALLWLALGIGPSLLTGPEAATTRSLGALPVIYVIPALAVERASKFFSANTRRHAGELGRNVWADFVPWRIRGSIPWLLFGAWVAFAGAVTARDYFVAWGQSPEVRAAYQSTLVAELAYLDAQPQGGAVVLSSVYPSAPHDPYIAEAALRRADLHLSWIDGREAFLFPKAAQARLIAPASAPLHPLFEAWLDAPGKRIHQHPDDLDPYFDVYEWEPPAALKAALAEAGTGAIWTGGNQVQALPARFGNAVELAGYRWLTPRVAPGDTGVLLTFWRVLDPQSVGPRVPPAFGTDAVLFIHLLNAEGAIVAQQDRLDAPSWDWQAGDVAAQLFRLAVPPEAQSGAYSAALGIYNRSDGARLPLTGTAGEVLGDSVRLEPLHLDPP